MAKKKASVTTMNEYKEQAQKDFVTVVESTEQMIDMHFTELGAFLEGKNIGELKAFRSLLQTHLDKTDVYGKQLVDTELIAMSKENKIKLGSVFAISAKIVDRMGYIDYLIKKNSIK